MNAFAQVEDAFKSYAADVDAYVTSTKAQIAELGTKIDALTNNAAVQENADAAALAVEIGDAHAKLAATAAAAPAAPATPAAPTEPAPTS